MPLTKAWPKAETSRIPSENHISGAGDIGAGILLTPCFFIEANALFGVSADTTYGIPLLAKSVTHHMDYHAYSGLVGVNIPLHEDACNLQLKAGASYVMINNAWSPLSGYFAGQQYTSETWQPTYGISILYTPPHQQHMGIFLSYLNILGSSAQNPGITPDSTQVSIADQKVPALHLLGLGIRVHF